MKDEFSNYIEEEVYLTTIAYYDKMLATKKDFYKSLLNEESYTEFKKKTQEIWGNINHEYMAKQIKELEEMVDKKNADGKPILNPNAEYKEIYELIKLGRFKEVELRFKELIDKYYYNKLKVIKREYVDKEKYLSDSVYDYDKIEQTIPYYSKDGLVHSYHTPASYLSMLYNVNLTRSAWNRTMYDGKLLNNNLVYLVAHPYACKLCIDCQGKLYSTDGTRGVKDGIKYEPKEVAIDNGVGHPNCRHVWTLYWDKVQIQKNKFNSEQWNEKYIAKQKLKALDLKRKKLETNADIFNTLNNDVKRNRELRKLEKVKNTISELKKSIGK